MRRDSIFYKLFQQYPSLLFHLLTNLPKNAEAYIIGLEHDIRLGPDAQQAIFLENFKKL